MVTLVKTVMEKRLPDRKREMLCAENENAEDKVRKEVRKGFVYRQSSCGSQKISWGHRTDMVTFYDGRIKERERKRKGGLIDCKAAVKGETRH